MSRREQQVRQYVTTQKEGRTCEDTEEEEEEEEEPWGFYK
jgi:hypothetical protein